MAPTGWNTPGASVGRAPAASQHEAAVRLYDVPAEILALCLDELDGADLGRLASVSRAFRDILSAPSTWERKASKALEVEGYGPLPGGMSRAVIAQQHIRDASKRKDCRGAPNAPGSEKKHKSSWEEDWSLPLCSWLSEPRASRLQTC